MRTLRRKLSCSVTAAAVSIASRFSRNLRAEEYPYSKCFDGSTPRNVWRRDGAGDDRDGAGDEPALVTTAVAG